MRKHGQFTHIIITAGLGILFWALTEVLFFGFGRLIFDGVVNILPSIVVIILHFALFCGCMFGTMHLLCKARGDYKGWADRNLLNVVSQNYKKAAIALIAVVVASGIFEFLYELEVIGGSSDSSYVFIIDRSGSMNTNDPTGERLDAIEEKMRKNKGVPYAVYSFSDVGQTILEKPMGKYKNEKVSITPNGGLTFIMDALDHVVNDIESGALSVGRAPKFFLLSDGIANDNYDQAVIDRCVANNVKIDTMYFTSSANLAMGRNEMMVMISANTGGEYREGETVDTAFGINPDRNLLGDWTGDILHAIMRVVMLALLGLCWSWMKQKAYCCAYEHKFADTVFFVSLALTCLAAILVELLFRFTPVPAYVIRLIFCILWAITPGIFWAGMPMQQNNNPYGGMYSNQGTFGNYDKIGF